ncbi:ribonuclease PH [Longimicrobium sp.]|uniref:ribonuclease PH n=1 Tax=Longimicrobium sp. TaxID=2029185 RepID=UPI002B6B701B|nr:ribonuclease PH [Longimicrobium sp.]HSU17590.1 ribonuclease PH [Longimicrobium sp.]
MARNDGRAPEQPRPLKLERGVAEYAEGSCLITVGRTRVLCTASVEEGVPGWKKGKGEGWVTAEYSMLPRATNTRNRRERGQIGGRTQEIQRLIGRSLRSCVDMAALGERQITIDCDVLQADGGTRTASITGGAVALFEACRWISETRGIESPFREFVAAVSAGLVDGRLLLDLDYLEDSAAEVDLNLVARESGGIIEVQGTGEHGHFSPEQLYYLTQMMSGCVRGLHAAQRAAVGG